MSYIKCIVFKKTGKYYTDENVFVNDDTNDYDIPQQIYENREIEDMIYIGKTLKFNVPFLIPAI